MHIFESTTAVNNWQWYLAELAGRGAAAAAVDSVAFEVEQRFPRGVSPSARVLVSVGWDV